MDALTLALDLQERGIELEARGEQLIARPAALLTDADRAAIRAHKAHLLRLVSADYSDLPDGWQTCPSGLPRLVKIQAGHLYDSITLGSREDAHALLAQLKATETRPDTDRNLC